MLLDAAEECHCIVTALYRLLNARIPDACRHLFEEKCQEAGSVGGSTVSQLERLHQSSSNPRFVNRIDTVDHNLIAFSPFGDFPGNLYRPPARRQSSATSANSQPADTSQKLSNGRLIKQNNGPINRPKMCEASTQTFSTGEITVLQVYYDT